ncbi:MAG TPA: Hsp20/alpha crystallin family protein [Geobacteraceae bacterium]
MAIIPKDPLDWLTLFRQQIDVLFNYLSTIELREPFGEHEYTPLIDVFDTVESHVVEIELPGFAWEDISLSICCSTLVVEGTKREEPKNCEVNYIRLERHFGRFFRAIEIPPGVDAEQVSARYEKGVLAVSFPKIRNKSVIRNIAIAQGE